MSATLRMTQETHSPADRRGRFEIEVDGTRVGSIENHKTVEVPLETGHHHDENVEERVLEPRSHV